MTDDRISSVWPFNDAYFEGDAVMVMLDRFGDVLGEHLSTDGYSIERVAEVVASLDNAAAETGVDAATQLLRMDAASGAERTLRALREPWREREELAGASFYFGAAWALMCLASEGVLESAGAQAWLRERQAEGGKSKPPPAWHALATRRAQVIWTEVPDRPERDVADEVHDWLKTPEAWAPMKAAPPHTADAVRRLIRRQVLAARPEVPDT